ncbi:hypothetical protein [Paenarthrobacter nitroguajacolicus]|nr:hypothetical protein [Paenarthrobacter nitroguajacolicus]
MNDDGGKDFFGTPTFGAFLLGHRTSGLVNEGVIIMDIAMGFRQ